MLGCIADDFTGATDLASVLASRGFRVRVEIGVLTGKGAAAGTAGTADATDATDATDEADAVDAVDAVIIALKTRTAPVADSVRFSIAAHSRLTDLGADRFYFKYCSTFDSTAHGNIGPVTDALLGAVSARVTVVVPSYPDTGRTVIDGRLLVHGVPLGESAMRHHPITPMRDSDLPALLAPQTVSRVARVGIEVVRAGALELAAVLDAISAEPGAAPVLTVVDAETNDDLAVIAAATARLTLVTGAAGLATGMAPAATAFPDRRAPAAFAPIRGERVILSGSASSSTLGQVAAGRDRMPSRSLLAPGGGRNEDAVGSDRVADLVVWARQSWSEAPGTPVLIYSAAERADVAGDDVPGDDAGTRTAAAARVEATFGALATRLIDAGARQLIVAGGETSGRVVGDLGIRTLELGPAIAPGVVWCSGRNAQGVDVTLALKSGNFGPEDMFTSAWEALP